MEVSLFPLTSKNQRVSRLKLGAVIVGAIVVASIVVHMRIAEHLNQRHPMRSIRQLTIWNLFITGIFLMLLPVLSASLTFVLGLAVAYTNLFVLVARSALLPFRERSAVWWTLDLMTHYFIPVTAIGILLVVWRRDGQTFGSDQGKAAIWKSLLIFLAILLAWFLFNLLLYKLNGTWAYGKRVGHVRHMKPKDGAALGGAIGGSYGLILLLAYVTKSKVSPP